jgi:hypothetical protein
VPETGSSARRGDGLPSGHCVPEPEDHARRGGQVLVSACRGYGWSDEDVLDEQPQHALALGLYGRGGLGRPVDCEDAVACSSSTVKATAAS